MRRGIRVPRFAVPGLAALVLVAYGTVYGISERTLRRTYDVPLLAFSAAADPALLAEGERLARIRGCIGCHGPAMEGQVFMDEPWVARMVAPDLTRVVQEYSDAELERVIRRGVTRDGRSVWIMPSPMFFHLSDDDLGAIIAYIRSVAPNRGLEGESRLRTLGRVGVALRQFTPLATEIDVRLPRMIVDREDPLAFGRYLALTACTECHGADLRGTPDGRTPDLRIAAAFTPDSFRDLMREGVGLGGRELGLMGEMGRRRFVHFTDGEITALHTYLRALVETDR